MADTVQIPGDGTVSTRWLLAGGALVAGIVGYAYLRRARSGTGEPTPPEPIDLPPADLGSVTTGGSTTDTGLQFITTDAQWTTDVLTKMDALAFDTNAVSIALGKWLNGQMVTRQEQQWIFAAIGLAGNPPSGSHPIRLEPTPTSTSAETPRPVIRVISDVPRGDRVNATQSLASYASHFSLSTSPDSIEKTRREILTLNPWLKARIIGSAKKPFTHERPVQAGWVLIVPRGIQR